MDMIDGHLEEKNIQENRKNKINGICFDDYLYRTILEHNDDYLFSFYENGLDPIINCNMLHIINYIKNNSRLIKQEDSIEKYLFNDYFFYIFTNQNKSLKIVNKLDNKIIFEL